MRKIWIFLCIFAIFCSPVLAEKYMKFPSGTPSKQQFPSAKCTEGQGLVADASGNLVCGAVGGAGAGDVDSVGDCLTGACLDGTSDGGTWIKFYDAQGAGQVITGDLTQARVWTTPDATGTFALGSGSANEIAYWSAANTLGTLAVATYPSLTELAYVKGVTSAIQTQLNAKGAIAGQVWTGTHDFGGATLEVPNSTSLPGTCTVGEIYMDTDATSGQRIYACESSDTWALQGDGGGSGGGNFFWVLEPQQAKLPASNPMAIDAGNARWRGLFDADTAESATWEGVLQPFSGTLKAKIFYTMASATADTVEFELSIDCFTDADAADFDTASFGTADALTATVPGTAGYVDVLSDASLNGDSCAEGDLIVVQIARDSDDVTNDTATGDAELRKVIIYAE